MKVGICTLHAVHNYGAALQALGLQTAIEELGHSVEFIHYLPDSMVRMNRRDVEVRNLKSLAKWLQFKLLGSAFRRRYQRFESFRDVNLKLSPRISAKDDLFGRDWEYDAVIAGSDQIWNIEQVFSPIQFLQFVRDPIRRVSYAPSFGVEAITDRHDETLRKVLERFDHISVREDSGRRKIKNLIGVDVPVVLDPVFLNPREYWESVAHKPAIDGPFMVFYSLELTSELQKLVTRIARERGYRIVILGKAGATILRERCSLRIDAGPAEFLGFIQAAEMVVTNSFHASAFAAIFETDLVVYPHKTRNTRMEHLLSISGAGSRFAKNFSEWERLVEIDWAKVGRALAPEVALSKEYLSSALEGGTA